MAKKQPYITIVISSRNDDYQGGSLKRFQLAINTLVNQAKKYNFNAELIVVEWNPPKDRPLLKNVLFLPKDLGFFTLRFIIVPELIHKQYGASKKINMIKGPDVNAGIRRAKGEFIFATNSDILFSDELIQFLASEKLNKQFFYRAKRFDVQRQVMQCANLQEAINFCRKNIIGSYLKDNISHHGLKGHPNLYINGGDFILLSKEHWHMLHGWPEINNIGLYSDGILCYMAYAAGLKENILEDRMCVYHIDHDSRWVKLVSPKNKIARFLKDFFYLKSNNVVLKKAIRKARHFFDGVIILFLDIIGRGKNDDFNIRRMRFHYEKALLEMLNKKRPFAYNNDLWGHPDEKFEEFVFSSGNDSI